VSDRVLIVSHPAVVALNQSVYLQLAGHGWDPLVVVPNRWHHEYSDGPFTPEALPGLEGRVLRRRVALPGVPQRHFYVSDVGAVIDRFRPRAAFLEQEPFAVSALQWGAALHRRGVPFGVQADENLDRPFPAPVRRYRRWVLEHAAFTAARSSRAAELVREWGATGPAPVIPHSLPAWPAGEPRAADGTFVVGYAGRLVPEKGLHDLLAAARGLEGAVRVLLIGDGEQREELAAAGSDLDLEIRTDVQHDAMPAAYRDMDVLVLPSHTTPTWAEQFGRVLVEALWSGVPVIGSDSGEIPWVIATTGGGLVFREGDVADLTRALAELQHAPDRRRELAAHGRQRAEELFTVEAVARGLDQALRASSS
jgi:glycosyltransferase involved in cell wall biosynthesis